MSKSTRRQFTKEQKAKLLKRHLAEKVPVSQICEENELQPSLFYLWQRQLIENAASAFETPSRAPNRERELEARIAQLESKLAKKDAVIAEISEEFVKLKKELGEP